MHSYMCWGYESMGFVYLQQLHEAKLRHKHLLTKREEAELIMVVKEYSRLHACQQQLAMHIKREPTWEELAMYTRTDSK